MSGQQLVTIATQKAKEKATPSRQHSLPPSQIIKTETGVVLLDSISDDVKKTLKMFVCNTIGKKVATVEQIKSELESQIATCLEKDLLR